jgi:hypothetical protein
MREQRKMGTTDRPVAPAPIAALYEWWERQRGIRPMPRRSELDPAILIRTLPDIVIIDVASGDRLGAHVFTYRLAGTRVDDRLGLNLKGRTVDTSLFGDAASSIQGQYETAVMERRPILCRHHAVVDGRRYVEYERLVAPLSSEDETEIVALVAAVHFDCAFSTDDGRPSTCRGIAACDREDLCVAPALMFRYPPP